MAKTRLAKVVLTIKGVWSPTVEYEKLDLVNYLGSSYIAKRDNIGVTPVEGDDWSLSAEKGGRGDPGEPGADAPQDVVRYAEQSLDSAQQVQARTNIGAASEEETKRLSEKMTDFESDLGILKGDTSTINIKTYGAIGDGLTDDTEAIAAAIAACRYGGSVFVPEGTYIVSDIALKSDMCIYGIGDGSIIKFADGVTAVNNSCIRADNVQNVRVEKLQLDGNSANNSMQVYQGDGGFDCIHVSGSSNVVIDSVNGHHAGYHGVIITESDNITVQNCIFHHNGFRPIHGLKNVTTIKVLNNECYSNGQGFEGEPNRFDGIFFFNASRDILIRGNYVHDVYNVGAIVVGGATDPGGTFGSSSNVRIEDNTIVTWPQLPTNLNTHGIYIIGDDVSDIRITGNTIRNSYNGIFLHNAKSGSKNSGIFIHNNLIENGQQYAIRLNHGSADSAYEDIVVTENSLINYGDNIGVECNNTKKVYIARNIFSGKTGSNSFAGIWGLGATEVIAESNFFVPRTGTLTHAVKFDSASKDCYFINNYVHTGQVTNDSVNGITEHNLPSATSNV